MSFFAPQAYTKETLSKAFEWLQHQPSSIKQAAANPDMLVSIYLQAQRQGLQKIDADAPVSSRKFIDDLKTLSRDFAQFDEPPAATNGSARQSVQQTTTISHHSSRTAEMHQPVHVPQQTPLHAQVQAHQAAHQPQHQVVQQQVQQPIPQPVPHYVNVAPPQPTAAPPQQAQHRPANGDAFTLDEKSLAVVRKLQERFNLSTPQEALRMLVALGIEQISRWN